MKHYSRDPESLVKSVKAHGANLRVHYKNMREAGKAIKLKTTNESNFLKYLIVSN